MAERHSERPPSSLPISPDHIEGRATLKSHTHRFLPCLFVYSSMKKQSLQGGIENAYSQALSLTDPYWIPGVYTM